MAYIISQIIGVVVCIFAVISLQTKNIKFAMLCQLICNGLGTVSYFLFDGGLSGCGIYLVATLQSLLFFILRTKEIKEPVWIYPIIFAAYIGCSILTFRYRTDDSCIALRRGADTEKNLFYIAQFFF